MLRLKSSLFILSLSILAQLVVPSFANTAARDFARQKLHDIRRSACLYCLIACPVIGSSSTEREQNIAASNELDKSDYGIYQAMVAGLVSKSTVSLSLAKRLTVVQKKANKKNLKLQIPEGRCNVRVVQISSN